MGRLDGYSALVTGGGRGIGAATARLYAQQGAKVGIMGKGAESLERTKANLADEGLAVETFVGDVSVDEDVARVVDDFAARFGRLDILVNNAGMSLPRPFSEKTSDEWIKVLRVNLIGTFLCSQAAARHMRAAGRGKIVNVTSVRALDHCGRAPVADYSAAKAAVVNLTRTLAKELAPKITVNAVAPGHTRTDMLRALPDEARRDMLAGTPLQRFAEPEEIANAILFLGSPESNFITGQQIVVDGGFSLKTG
ncbi:MAG: 3-oxoacyl-ACP reductase FabG [Bradyrhizobium sp.]|nr:3-oxoacyl-ACP reductase FabG [Bradyrhizobium sp.]